MCGPHTRSHTLSPDGHHVSLEVDNFVPYLLEAPQARGCMKYRRPAVPAAEAAEQAEQQVDGDAAVRKDGVSEEEHGEDIAVPDVLSESEVRDLKKEAVSLNHLMTHRRKNPYCASCQRAKHQAKPARRKAKRLEDPPTQFGDIVTSDHMITQSQQDQGTRGETTCMVMLDRATSFIGVYPLASKTAEDAREALGHFLGGSSVKIFHTDCSGELAKAARELGITHDTSTPGRPTSNGVAIAGFSKGHARFSCTPASLRDGGPSPSHTSPRLGTQSRSKAGPPPGRSATVCRSRGNVFLSVRSSTSCRCLRRPPMSLSSVLKRSPVSSLAITS